MRRVLAVVAAVLPVLAVSPAVAAPATSWKGVPTAPTSGDTESVFFEDVEVVSATAVFASGWARHTLPGVSETRNLVERWDGRAWHIENTPDNDHAPASNFLFGISAAAADDVWAVGTDFGNAGPETAYTLHYDGAHWALATLPSPIAGRAGRALDVAVVDRSRTWAVGSADSIPSVGALWHRNGARWSTVALPKVPGCRADEVVEVTQVVALRTGGAYASGYCGTARGDTAFILRLDSLFSWHVVQVLPFASAIEEMDIAPDGTVYAAGRRGTESNAQPLVLSVTGDTVTVLPRPPRAGATPYLTSVAVTQDGVTVGGSGVQTATSLDPYVATWHDGTWTQVPVVNARGVTFTALDGLPTKPVAWAMGRAGADPRGSSAKPVRSG